MNKVSEILSEREDWHWSYDTHSRLVCDGLEPVAIACIPHDRDTEKQEAYGKLMATAPKLLQVVFELLRHRIEDKDGNYVCWVGESLFIKAEEAFCEAIGEPKDYGPTVPFEDL